LENIADRKDELMNEVKGSEAARGVHHIEVFAEARPIENWRMQVVAGQPDAGRFAFIADEGDYFPGGEGTAPTPLSYFIAGVAL
jgi:hypothetical protein